MIISASYKTDIPAFYGTWFANRLEAGYCKMVNPYNANQRRRVSLRRDDVDGFVFWTKNLGPFLGVLAQVSAKGFPFVIQYTINGYPRALEASVVSTPRSIEHMRSIAERYGPRVAVWRYDPILFSDLTTAKFHTENFAALARELSGSTDEVVVSFMQVYKKTRVNLDRTAGEYKFNWLDPSADTKQALLFDLSKIASDNGMRLKLCSQPSLSIPSVTEARCIDADRLIEVGGRFFSAKLRGMRETCGCFRSIDIGEYDTCPHGCVYCYAVRNRTLAVDRFQSHDPNGEYLFPVAHSHPDVQGVAGQLSLFDS